MDTISQPNHPSIRQDALQQSHQGLAMSGVRFPVGSFAPQGNW